VWDVLADARAWSAWGPWQRTVLEREGTNPAPDGVGAVRAFTRWPVTTREEVVEFEPPSRFGYTLLSGVPVRDYRAEVVLTDAGEGGTNIHWQSAWNDLRPRSGWVMRRLIEHVIGDVARRVAREAERRA
jgi:hypothetical protein